jgi:hypothetical protein
MVVFQPGEAAPEPADCGSPLALTEFTIDGLGGYFTDTGGVLIAELGPGTYTLELPGVVSGEFVIEDGLTTRVNVRVVPPPGGVLVVEGGDDCAIAVSELVAFSPGEPAPAPADCAGPLAFAEYLIDGSGENFAGPGGMLQVPLQAGTHTLTLSGVGSVEFTIEANLTTRVNVRVAAPVVTIAEAMAPTPSPVIVPPTPSPSPVVVPPTPSPTMFAAPPTPSPSPFAAPPTASPSPFIELPTPTPSPYGEPPTPSPGSL